jgi:hypothetical protein
MEDMMNKILKRLMGFMALAVFALALMAPQAFGAYHVKEAFVRITVNAGETLATGDVVMIKDADGEAYQADANDGTLRPAVGIVGSLTGGDGEPVEIIIVGIMSGWSSLSEGTNGYLSETAGEIDQSAPSYEQKVGFAISTTDYLVNFQNYFDSSAVTSLGVLSGASPIILEGDTADAYETTIAVTDPTADRTVTLADAAGTVMLSSLATNGADAANAVTGASNALVFEGTTADDYETSVTSTDPTADNTITLPDDSGAITYSPGGGTTSDGDSLAIPITHAYVAKTTGNDGEALTLADGENGQILTIVLVSDGGGDGTLTPTTKSGFETIVFEDEGDTATLLYVDDVVGWVIMGLAGVAAPPAITV